MSLTSSELNINPPESETLLRGNFKIRSSKNADEITKEKEIGMKLFFKKE